MHHPPARFLLALFAAACLTGCSLFGARPAANPPVPAEPAPAPVATPTAPADTRPIILCFGDSLTFGQGLDDKESYPQQLQRRLDAGGYRYHVVNQGISGDTSAGGLDRLQAGLDLKPRILILELGANDGLRGQPVKNIRQNLAQIIERSQAAHVTVVLAGMQMLPNLGPDYTQAFAAVFPDLAQQYKTPLIPFFLAGVGGVRSLNQNDLIHPTAEGTRLVVDNVWQVLAPLLAK